MSDLTDNGISWSTTEGSSVGESPDELYVKPYAVIIANLPRPKCEDYNPLAKYLKNKLRFRLTWSSYVWKKSRPTGYTVIQLQDTEESFKKAMCLHRLFEKAGHGKVKWTQDDQKEGPYLWIATANDESWFKHYEGDLKVGNVPAQWKAKAIARAVRKPHTIFRGIRLFTARFKYANRKMMET